MKQVWRFYSCRDGAINHAVSDKIKMLFAYSHAWRVDVIIKTEKYAIETNIPALENMKFSSRVILLLLTYYIFYENFLKEIIY